MKKIRIILAILLILSFISASCSGNPDGVNDTTTVPAGTGTESIETEAAETGRLGVKDSLPADLNYNGAAFRIFSSNESKNEFIQGPAEQSGDIVFDTVIERNMIVEERLNVKFEYHAPTYALWEIAGVIRTVVLAGDDVYDLIIAPQYGMCLLVNEGLFLNVLDGKYFNFSEPWWNLNYMREISIGKNKLFYLVGDYFIDMLRGTRILYFNKNLWEDYFPGNDLYDIIFDGKWTLEKMTGYVKQVYSDLNGDGVRDKEDMYGYVTTETYSSVDAFSFATDIEFIKRDADGLITLNINNEKSVKLAEMLYNLFYNEGSTLFPDTDTVMASFQAGNILFMGNGTFVRAEMLRDMEKNFGIITNPKFDETQKNYRSVVADGQNLGVVPITTSAGNLEMTSAVVEALNAESYRRVVPAYYETALKVKYTRDDVSSQMIDLIRDSTMTTFVFAFYASMNDIGAIFRTLVTNKSIDFTSEYAKLESGALAGLEKLQAAFLENY
ncbi:MAG: hypothetical protein FWF15_07995 [Oscillospiraceae bacterium]|nr:hypothetical protein [Oscillospiraceae bacterium]